MMLGIDDDAELLEAWRGGDAAAGNTLFRRHFSTLYRFFASRVGDDAADLIQQTLLGCVESSRAGWEMASFRAYLLGIARNKLLMYFRAQRRGGQTQPLDRSVPDLDPSLQGQVALREEQRLLLRALRGLPIDQQLTIELFYWEQLPMAEIARVLDVKPGSVNQRLYRAREALKRGVLEQARGPSGQTTVKDFERWARSLKEILEVL